MNMNQLLKKSEYINISNISNISNSNKQCSICLQKLNNTCRKLCCGHIFHIKCIDIWLSTHVKCYTCNTFLINNILLQQYKYKNINDMKEHLYAAC